MNIYFRGLVFCDKTPCRLNPGGNGDAVRFIPAFLVPYSPYGVQKSIFLTVDQSDNHKSITYKTCDPVGGGLACTLIFPHMALEKHGEKKQKGISNKLPNPLLSSKQTPTSTFPSPFLIQSLISLSPLSHTPPNYPPILNTAPIIYFFNTIHSPSPFTITIDPYHPIPSLHPIQNQQQKEKHRNRNPMC